MNAREKDLSLNLNIRGLGKSPTLAINELSKKLSAQGKKIYRMGLGQSPFPVPEPVVEALRYHAGEKDYLNVNGLEQLRKAVAKFHRQKDDADAKADRVLIGPGSKELMFLMQLVFYGEIILPTPCWVSYAPQAKIIGRHIMFVPTSFEDEWRITPDQLGEYLASEHDKYKPRLMVLNYPANPDGGTYPAEELKEIAKIAMQYEMIILSDEIYGQLHHEGEHVSIAKYYPEGTIISSGLSKWCGAGGWRLGTFSFPPRLDRLLEAMAAVASETYTSVSAPIQYAAVRAFRGGIQIERYLWRARKILSFIAKRLTKIFRDSGIKTIEPKGGFYLFLDFSNLKDDFAKAGIKTSEELCKRLLNESGVAILAGSAFGRPREELTARLSYVNFDGAKALAASERFNLGDDLPEEFGEIHLFGVFEGAQKIVEWMETITNKK